MSRLFFRYTTAVWFLLSVLTGLSWWLAFRESADSTAADIRIASCIMLLLAFFKVRLIGLHFMELRYAPWALRIAFEGWAVVTCCIVLGIYLNS